MQCREFEQYVEQGLAGQVAADDAAAHLNQCASCRAMASDLEAIGAVARQLAVGEVEPLERVWHALRAQLEAEGLIRTPQPTGGRRSWFAVLPRPALAGAYLALLFVAALVLGIPGNLRQEQAVQPGAPQPATALLSTQLIRVERGTVSSIHQHNPDVTASLQQNLDLVDNFIALCEKSVRENPENGMAREYLYGAYQQKAELLAAMMDRNTTGD